MTAQAQIGPVRIEVVEGDIASQPGIDAVVNAANAQLLPGGGVAGAIHRGAGPGLSEECRPLAPIRPGGCVITGGHDLPNPKVIHCLGPVFGRDEPSAELLASCYREALRIADAEGLCSVAFPAISTGIFAYPLEEAAEIAVSTVAQCANELQHVRHVRFVLYGDTAVGAFSSALARHEAGSS